MRWDRGRMKDLSIGDLAGIRSLSIGDLARLRKLSLDDLPWATQSSPWPMVGVFGLGLSVGVLAGIAVGAGPARRPVEQAAGWTRDRGQKVAQRVRRASDEDADRQG